MEPAQEDTVDEESEALIQVISYLPSDPLGLASQWPLPHASPDFPPYKATAALPPLPGWITPPALMEPDTNRALGINLANLKLTDLYSQIGFEEVLLADGFENLLEWLPNSRQDWWTEMCGNILSGVPEILIFYLVHIIYSLFRIRPVL